MTETPMTTERLAEIRSLDLLSVMQFSVAPVVSGALADLIAEIDRLAAQRKFLLGQLAKRDAESGGEAVGRFFGGEQSIAEAESARPAPSESLTVYRASHDSIVMGLYTTREAAREHCEAYVRREIPGAAVDWIEDEDDGVDELAAAFGEDERSTGHTVMALEVAARYDSEADE
ncbi:hypothetical protein ACIQXD_29545 [Streptomyces uncialis]|uniref:hypothetical protein n=1 Tax=Streptomyces uncialis TaxID=1048205 RepID=UPI003810645A